MIVAYVNITTYKSAFNTLHQPHYALGFLVRTIRFQEHPMLLHQQHPSETGGYQVTHVLWKVSATVRIILQNARHINIIVCVA